MSEIKEPVPLYVGAWLKGPDGGPGDYLHSEGVCDGTPGIHDACIVDAFYTLRKALQFKRKSFTVPNLDTAEERKEALQFLRENWCHPLPQCYVDAAGVTG